MQKQDALGRHRWRFLIRFGGRHAGKDLPLWLFGRPFLAGSPIRGFLVLVSRVL
jgi:hypothetical protein